MTSHSSKTTTNHDEIRHWAEARKATPARVKGTGSKNDPGMIRLDFPGYSGESLEPISWDEWFEAFDANKLALVYQDQTADGARSNFNKLIGRETADEREHGDSHASRHHDSHSGSRTTSHTSVSHGAGTHGESSHGGSHSPSQHASHDSHGSAHRNASSGSHGSSRGSSHSSSHGSSHGSSRGGRGGSHSSKHR